MTFEHGLRRATVKCLTVACLLQLGCATSYRMGDPIKAAAGGPTPRAAAAPSTVPATQTIPAPIHNPKLDKKRDEWDAKWQEIQSPADKTSWSDHFKVCALKYRYRNYDELFRCLDLLDAKVAQGGPRVHHLASVRRGLPVLTGWLRASAYAELGEPEVALKWADSAWKALPEGYRDASWSVASMWGEMLNRPVWDYAGVAMMVGGGYAGTARDASSGPNWDPARAHRDNPAALAVNAETVAMSLAAQRSLLYAQLGNLEQAKTALAQLHRWEDLHKKDSVTGAIPTAAPYRTEAQLLSLGPLFAMGDYSSVVRIYESAEQRTEAKRHREQALQSAGWVLLFPLALLHEGALATGKAVTAPFTAGDLRLFSIATEDVSNALLYAQALARVGKTEQAQRMLDTLLALPEIRAMGNLYWVALYERALIALKNGQRDQAISYLRQSVAAIESVRSTISLEAAKIGFAGDKQAVYGVLVAALSDAGDWNGAFLIAERAKARALVDLLAQRHDLAPPAAADDRVRELFAHAQTAETRVGLPSDDATVRGIKLVAESRASLVSVAPEAASLVSVQTVGLTDLGKHLTHDEILIDYYGVGDDLYAFVLEGGTVKGFKLSGKTLDDDVRAFRDCIERRDPRSAELGRALYNRLIAPLAAELHSDKLTIAPNGALHYLPFVALSDGEHYLLDRFSIRIIPSANALTYLKSDRPAKPGKLLALGNPDLGSARFDLPNAQLEAVNVAAMFPDSRALVRGEASKSAVKELGNGFAILHFATHGKFDADSPLSSGLYLAKGSEPNGVLTVSDLYSLRWDVELVTLSACETGLGKVASGDDVIGLTRGFLYAGARSIVASLWEVDDAATEKLMTSFYRNLEGHDKREALRLAQLETRERYPEPRYWAAFQIMGRAD